MHNCHRLRQEATLAKQERARTEMAHTQVYRRITDIIARNMPQRTTSYGIPGLLQQNPSADNAGEGEQGALQSPV